MLFKAYLKKKKTILFFQNFQSNIEQRLIFYLQTLKDPFIKTTVNFTIMKCHPSKFKSKQPEPIWAIWCHRYLGMMNYLSRYIPYLSTVLELLNELLSNETIWTWDPQQATSFQKVKEMLTTALAYFAPTKQAIVEADSSSYGLRGYLLKEHKDGLKPVAFCSRRLSNTEQKYAQILKRVSCSGVGLRTLSQILEGSFNIDDDHKPLVPLLNSKDLSNKNNIEMSAHAQSTDALHTDRRVSTKKDDGHVKYFAT